MKLERSNFSSIVLCQLEINKTK